MDKSSPESRMKSPPRKLTTTAPSTPGAQTMAPIEDLAEVFEQWVAPVFGCLHHPAVLVPAQRQPVRPADPVPEERIDGVCYLTRVPAGSLAQP